MTMRHLWNRSGASIALAVLGMALALALVESARSQDGPAKPRPTPTPTPYIDSERNCFNCHSNKDHRYEETNVICRMNESILWRGKDKHKLAYEVLEGERGRAIGARLGLGADVAGWRDCLGCHSVVPTAPGTVVSELFRAHRREEGVSCVACHGAFVEWVQRHQNPDVPGWRGLARAEKARDFGMVDLWNPTTRLESCVSCHVGDAPGGKVLTHPMYAAGHPPLPGIEAATFGRAQPHHWEYLREKLARLGTTRPEVRALLERQYDLKKLEQAELVAVSGLVPLRASLALFVAQAEPASRGEKADARPHALAPAPAPAWPDFARYDCSACHHDVTRESWRQRRPFADAPGRPPAPTWPEALVALGVEAAGTDQAARRLDDYRRLQADFRKALGARPYGDRPRVAAAARALVAWIDGVLVALRQATFDPALSRRLLARTCRLARDGPVDFDTARQLFWAFQAVSDELDPDRATPLRAALDALDSRHQFRLPDAGVQAPIERTLPERLKAAERFDPDLFRVEFEALARLLPVTPGLP